MYPDKITRLEYGRDTFGERLVCLGTEINTEVGDVTIEFGIPVRNVPRAHLPMHTL